MRYSFLVAFLSGLISWPAIGSNQMLGLPPVPIPEDNPITDEKVHLGEMLFTDARFSADGTVSCSTCHEPKNAFTDSPLSVSEGIVGSDGSSKLTGTRNAPTVLNAAYFTTQFWDGRSPSLEDQAQHPFLNPVEMGLPNHDSIVEIVRSDKSYGELFMAAFGKPASDATIDDILKAIATFERTAVAGNSPFDRYHFGGDESAMTEQQVRGFDVFLNEGRCVSCHTIEQNYALFTDNLFHNIGVGINQIQGEVPPLVSAFLDAKNAGVDVDQAVLSDQKTSELGRFAVTDLIEDLGAFKTSTLRNIALTAPYMHDGSLTTLHDVVVHYNLGGKLKESERVNDFLSGGIRPLNLSEQQIDDLVAFLEALTSSQFDDRVASAVSN